MQFTRRFKAVTAATTLLIAAAGCTTQTTTPVSSYPSGNYPAQTTYPSQPVYPQQTYPAATTYPAPTQQQAYQEFGRINSIDYVQGATTTTNSPNTRNAVIGGVIGAVVGNVVGKNYNDGKNRAGGTVLGAAGGAAIGSQVGKNQSQNSTNPAYRVVVTTDQGVARTFEVPSPGDLRIGDRVRIENGVIYRV